MSHSLYPINKGVNRPLEFKGLKAQYLIYLAVGLVGLLFLFAICYLIGIPSYLCIALVAIGGTVLFHFTYQFSKRYGQYGLMKKRAAGRIPHCLVARSRTIFMVYGTETN